MLKPKPTKKKEKKADPNFLRPGHSCRTRLVPNQRRSSHTPRAPRDANDGIILSLQPHCSAEKTATPPECVPSRRFFNSAHNTRSTSVKCPIYAALTRYHGSWLGVTRHDAIHTADELGDDGTGRWRGLPQSPRPSTARLESGANELAPGSHSIWRPACSFQDCRFGHVVYLTHY